MGHAPVTFVIGCSLAVFLNSSVTLIVSVSRSRSTPLVFLLLLILALPTIAEENPGWHISPMLINLGVGGEQPLQALDASGHELAASDWSVDSPELVEIRKESGHVAVFAKAAGVVHVTAFVQGSALTAEIKIWLLEPGMVIGLHWVVPSTGHELGALQSVPSIDGPDIFTLDQNDQGTYLRAFTNRGVQLWMWRVPAKEGKAELMCGDNKGGAILTVARANAYTLYVAGKDGKLQWQHTFEGIRKGYALNAGNLIAPTESIGGRPLGRPECLGRSFRGRKVRVEITSLKKMRSTFGDPAIVSFVLLAAPARMRCGPRRVAYS